MPSDGRLSRRRCPGECYRRWPFCPSHPCHISGDRPVCWNAACMVRSLTPQSASTLRFRRKHSSSEHFVSKPFHVLTEREMPRLFSVVIPAYNEEEVLPLLRDRLTEAIDAWPCPVE